MKNKDLYIQKGLVANEELSELDFAIRDEFGFDWENGEYHEIDRIVGKGLRVWYADTTPIKIDDLENLITKFKKKGATHMQMAHHGDHHGYLFSGFKVELAPQELIDRYLAENVKRKELLDERFELSNKMKIINDKLEELKV
jgi:hypothetical protein